MTDLNVAYKNCANLSGHTHDQNCYCGAHPHAHVRTQGHVEDLSKLDMRFYDPEYHRSAMPYFNDPKYNRVCGAKNTALEDGKNIYVQHGCSSCRKK